MLEIDSPGGSVQGIAETANMIHNVDAVKPVVSSIRDIGASAGYWLASQAREIVVAQPLRSDPSACTRSWSTVAEDSRVEARRRIS